MNKMKKVLMTMFGLVMLPLLFACSNNQSAGIEAIKSKGKLVVALNPDFAPFEYQKVVDGKNQIVGSDIELAKAIATELGVELELSPMSFDNVLASVQSGKADLAISGVSKTDERSKVFDFSTPYYTAKNKLIVKKSDLATYQSVNDLAQKKVGAQKGSIQETMAKDLLQNSSLVSLPKNGNLITDLKSGQVDAVIFEEPVAKGFVENNPDLAIADLNFEKEQDDSYAVAMKKDSKELKEAVDKTIQKLKESGELDKLIEDAFKASIENRKKEKNMSKEKVILAYSGGLDTSVAITWLKKDYDVVSVCMDVGEGKDLDFIHDKALKVEHDKALKVGAVESYVIDVKDEFATDYVLVALQSHAYYEQKYPLVSALSRPLISKKLVEIAHQIGATTIAHGCTGKGNDQVEYQIAVAKKANEAKK